MPPTLLKKKQMQIGTPKWPNQMEKLLEILNEGVIVADESHHILFVNSGFTKMTGITPEEARNLKPSRFYSSAELDFLRQQIEVAFRQGHNRYAFYLPRKDGGRVPVVISSRVLEDPGGRKLGIVTFTDITDQIQAEESLRSLNAHLEQRQKEIDEDLELAARIQMSLAPKPVNFDGISVDAFYHSVHEIGGDFAMVLPPDEDRLGLLVGDVSGHGIGSALIANRVYSETLQLLGSRASLAEILRQLNQFVIKSIDMSELFITLAVVRISRDGRRMFFAGAGHPPAILARPGQKPRLLESHSMILGVFPYVDDEDGTVEIELRSDDRIVFYTDGITEVFDARGAMLGVEGLQGIVHQLSSRPAEEMKQGILDAVAAWREGPPTDDVSLVVVHIR